ncbi:MAG: ABC transporter ATP-binding protein [Oscillospiraceae bacterium]|nr:ABC transporter ATP-binding protein [Oscillospiraceae bacterium]
MLQLKEVSKRFGDTTAVDGVSFSLREKSAAAVLGASGSGKSTLLRLIAGLEKPDFGEIQIDGAPAEPELCRRGVAMVFQSPALWNHMSVRDNILFGAPKEEREALAERLAEALGLEGLLSRKPYEISGGQAKRVAIARALACRRGLLLLDEPLSNLDPETKAGVIRVLQEQARGKTAMLLVTHDAGEAAELCDRVLYMRSGRLWEGKDE